MGGDSSYYAFLLSLEPSQCYKRVYKNVYEYFFMHKHEYLRLGFQICEKQSSLS